jgi:hypothetical protein
MEDREAVTATPRAVHLRIKPLAISRSPVSLVPGPEGPPRWYAIMNWLYILLSIFMAGVFYSIRCQCRFLYGICEVLLGLAAISLTIIPPYTLIVANLSDLGSYFLKGTVIIGSIYIIVRGLDNIDNDLPPILRGLWDYLFRNALPQCALRHVARRIRLPPSCIPPSAE